MRSGALGDNLKSIPEASKWALTLILEASWESKLEARHFGRP